MRPVEQRNHALDGLRAVAALLIVVYHMGLSQTAVSFMAGGHPALQRLLSGFGSSGVELFFTLSAVVLLKPYMLGTRPMKVGEYLARRVKRLWPPFLAAWILAGFAVAVIGRWPTWWPSSMPSFDLLAWGSQAFIFYAGTHAYNFAWWTLSIEIIFYVIAPLVTLTFVGRPVQFLVAAFAASIAVAEFAAACSFLPVPIVKFLAFASCFMGGVILARTGLPRAARIALAVVGAAWVAASLWSLSINGHIGYGLLYMAAVAETLEPASGLRRLLGKPVFVWFGERSYSIFLTHFSAIVLASWAVSHVTPHKGIEFFIASRLLACVLSLLVACVLFEGVERRFAHGLVTTGQWLPWRARLVEPNHPAPGRSPAPSSP